MPANEFEKQVQKKLEEFRLDPSASVWEKVEGEVRKKKRRRVLVFYILPAALCLLGYSFYHFITAGQKEGPVQQQVTISEKANKKEIRSNEKENTVQQPATNNTDSPTDATKKQKHESLPVQQDNVQVLTNKASIGHVKGENAGKHKYKNEPVKIKQDNSLVINNTIPGKSHIAKPAGDEENKTKEVIAEVMSPGNETQKNNITANDKNVVPVKKDSSSADAVAATDNKEIVPPKNNGKPKIKWGINFSAGLTSNQSRLFALAKSNSDPLSFSTPPITAGNPGGASVIIPPSSIRPGLSFRLGVVGELKLSPRSRISAGLEYAYASNRIKTGVEIDTSIRVQGATSYNNTTQVDRVYRGAQKNDYTNRYHFVSIPLGYHWQINKSKKWPLQWDIAASFNYLVTTNALVYTITNGGIYYPDKQAINKTHVDIGTGLSLRLKGKTGTEWVFGPEVSFDTRRLVNSQYDSKQYLLYGGVHTTILFPQKKK